MVREMKDAVAEIKQSTNRWKSDLARAEAEGQSELATEIRRWIKESEHIIAGYEQTHASERA
jgi:hypothetical protein